MVRKLRMLSWLRDYEDYCLL